MPVFAPVNSLILMAFAVAQIVGAMQALIRHDDGRKILLAVIVAIGGFGSFLLAADSFVRLMFA